MKEEIVKTVKSNVYIPIYIQFALLTRMTEILNDLGYKYLRHDLFYKENHIVKVVCCFRIEEDEETKEIRSANIELYNLYTYLMHIVKTPLFVKIQKSAKVKLKGAIENEWRVWKVWAMR